RAVPRNAPPTLAKRRAPSVANNSSPLRPSLPGSSRTRPCERSNSSTAVAVVPAESIILAPSPATADCRAQDGEVGTPENDRIRPGLFGCKKWMKVFANDALGYLAFGPALFRQRHQKFAWQLPHVGGFVQRPYRVAIGMQVNGRLGRQHEMPACRTGLNGRKRAGLHDADDGKRRQLFLQLEKCYGGRRVAGNHEQLYVA